MPNLRTSIILDRGDFRTDLDARAWENFCDQLDLDPPSGRADDYPESVTIYTSAATVTK